MRNRPHKPCPECGKQILLTSSFCYSCSQKGARNNHFVTGIASKERKCCSCGGEVTSGSKKGLCSACYTKSLLGDTNPNYKTGFYANKVYNTKEYTSWKLSVFERDNRVCAMCGNKDVGHTYHAHHIRPKRDYPDLILDINNGITLCKECHAQLNTKEYDYIEFFENKIMENQVYVIGGLS